MEVFITGIPLYALPDKLKQVDPIKYANIYNS